MQVVHSEDFRSCRRFQLCNRCI